MNAFGKGGREIGIGIGLSFCITLTVMAIYHLGGFQWLELHTYDMRMNFRGPQSLQSPILLVLNDEQTVTHLGIGPSRVSRRQYAQAIQYLHRAKARLIVLDVVFFEAGSQEENQMLADAIAQAGNVVLARYIGPDESMTPLPIFQTAAMGEGLINVRPDSDGVLRAMPLLGLGFAQDQFRPFLTLGAEVGRLYFDPEGISPLNLDTPGLAKVGPIHIPIEQNTLLINFAGPSGTFPSLPFWKIVNGEFSPNQVSNQIVMLGSSAATLQDFHHTPFSQKETSMLNSQSASVSGTRMSGVEVHANLLNTFLTRQFIVHSSPNLVLLLIGTIGVICCLLITLIPKGELGVVLGVIGLLGTVIGLSVFLFQQYNYWLDTVPLLAIINGHFALATAYQRYLVIRHRDHLQTMLLKQKEN